MKYIKLKLTILKNKIFIIVVFIFLIVKFISPKYRIIKNIFTFWEPKKHIPGYLQLCIKTWKKYLPEYNITILDYEKIKELLGETLFSKIICKEMPKVIQSDAIRVAILKKYGGIWMDTDTIIFNGEFLKKFHNYELGMIGFEEFKCQFIGFIYGRENCFILNEWLKQIIDKVKIYKDILKFKNNSTFWKKSYEKVTKVVYLGNDIIDPILDKITRNKYFRLSSNKINALPERKYFKNAKMNDSEKFRLFYFQKGNPEILFKNKKALILLHNGWTPKKYKNMTEKEFLNQDILLSKLLKKLLFEDKL